MDGFIIKLGKPKLSKLFTKIIKKGRELFLKVQTS